MAAPPRLDDNEVMLLKLLASRRDYLRGGEAMRMLRMEREPFVRLVLDLAKKNLVQISGPIADEKIDFATLAVHPSNFSFVHSL
jgi:hypothetical protein